jgi:hypothetical protein
MGKNRASGEGIIGDFVWKEVLHIEDEYLSIMQNTVHLYSLSVDKLKFVHSKSFEYKKYQFIFNLEANLMVKKIIGEKNYD